MAPASEAVKAPLRMPPTTNSGTNSAGMASRKAAMRSRQPMGLVDGSSPRRRACMCTVIIKATAIIRPGTIPAVNSAPTETAPAAEKMIMPMLGGIRLSMVDAQLVTAAANGLG